MWCNAIAQLTIKPWMGHHRMAYCIQPDFLPFRGSQTAQLTLPKRKTLDLWMRNAMEHFDYFSFSKDANLILSITLTGNWSFTVFIVKPTQWSVFRYFSTWPADVVNFHGWAMGKNQNVSVSSLHSLFYRKELVFISKIHYHIYPREKKIAYTSCYLRKTIRVKWIAFVHMKYPVLTKLTMS